jgi:hypothetical protein
MYQVPEGWWDNDQHRMGAAEDRWINIGEAWINEGGAMQTANEHFVNADASVQGQLPVPYTSQWPSEFAACPYYP